MKISAIVMQLCIALMATFPAHAVLIDNSRINVSGTLFNPVYSRENTIDDDRNTFWHGTNDIQVGDVDYLAYRFDQFYSFSRIAFFNDYVNKYALGELSVQVSADSTNGMDGAWDVIATIDGDFILSDFSLNVATDPVRWVRLWMEYQGRGAHGGTPAFYLSEIDFHGEVSTVPEPSTLTLMCLGLAGLFFLQRSRLTCANVDGKNLHCAYTTI